MPHLAVTDKRPRETGDADFVPGGQTCKGRCQTYGFPRAQQPPQGPGKPSLLLHVALPFQKRHSCLGILSSQCWEAPAQMLEPPYPKVETEAQKRNGLPQKAPCSEELMALQEGLELGIFHSLLEDSLGALTLHLAGLRGIRRKWGHPRPSLLSRWPSPGSVND